MKNFLVCLALILASFLGICLVLEIVLRFLPVNMGTCFESVDADHPVLHLRENRTFDYSRRANFSMHNVVHVNNHGFVNDQDYVTSSPLPVLAVVGDSFIEAVMIPYRQTVQGILAEALKGRYTVYSFAVSGAPLSQYLIWAEYAVKTFGAKKLIISVVDNDFDESLLEFKNHRGYHYFAPDPNGELALTRVDYKLKWRSVAMRQSHLIMYLLNNLEFVDLGENIERYLNPGLDPRKAGHAFQICDASCVAKCEKAVDAFFRLLPQMTGLGPSDIMFTLDAMRPDIYDPDMLTRNAGTLFGRMREYFVTKAGSLGYAVLDVQPVFTADYAKNGRKFEYEYDGHWNEYGHGLVAGAIRHSDFFARLP